MASYALNEAAVDRARRLILGRQYVLNSDWGDVQPRATEENAFLESHSWSEYAEWHLGFTDGAADETKARYAFAYGDFRRLHRTGLIACHYRAAEWRHKEVELAAHDCSSSSTARAPESANLHRSVGVGERGFEPLKAEPTGLQPVPFGHLGTPPAAADCS
jgi:hypothetical protein